MHGGDGIVLNDECMMLWFCDCAATARADVHLDTPPRVTACISFLTKKSCCYRMVPRGVRLSKGSEKKQTEKKKISLITWDGQTISNVENIQASWSVLWYLLYVLWVHQTSSFTSYSATKLPNTGEESSHNNKIPWIDAMDDDSVPYTHVCSSIRKLTAMILVCSAMTSHFLFYYYISSNRK